jgi:hypothetical protein
MGRFVISCKDAAILSDRAEYDDLNSKDKFRLKLHHGYCLRCRAYAKMNAAFTRKLKSVKWIRLSEKKKDELRKLIKNNMN